jgi:uncharacterized protein YjbI with pentapeptide repeats
METDKETTEADWNEALNIISSLALSDEQPASDQERIPMNPTRRMTAKEMKTAYEAGERNFEGVIVEAHANLRDADLGDANLSGATLYGASLLWANLFGADLSGAKLLWADLRNANLSGANLRNANLSNANLRANLQGANLSNATLYDADLFHANLFGADLSGANLFGANLSGANLFGADLRYANLSGADLSGADLSDANLYGAKLHNANLRNANLSNITMNWHSYELIAERLLQAAIASESSPEFQAWCTLIGAGGRLGYCWKQYVERLPDDFQAWALSVMRTWMKNGDWLPDVFEIAIA